MTRPVSTKAKAERDPRLTACVTSRLVLTYADGASTPEDRPPFVRAASGIAWFGETLAIVQDDANFVARFDPGSRRVDAIALPRGPGGLRQFDDVRGNKADKLDLECCVTARIDGIETFLAFGSGSSPARERVAVVTEQGEPRLVDASPLYAAFRRCPEFSGGELNIEGVALAEDAFRFFQRGNGAPRGSLTPLDSTVDVPRAEVLACLRGQPVQISMQNVVNYELGALQGTRLTFTDGTECPDGRSIYLATAEASPDALHDGPVTGSVLGLIDGNDARWTPLVDGRGEPFVEKVEGVVLDRADVRRVFVVIDPDDPSRPSELCEVELRGPWW